MGTLGRNTRARQHRPSPAAPPEPAPAAAPQWLDGGIPSAPVQPRSDGREAARLEVGSAIGYGWKKFAENAPSFVMLTIAVLLATVVIQVGKAMLFPTSTSLVAVLLLVVTYAAISIVQAGLWRAGLATTRGEAASLKMLVKTKNLGLYVLTQILVVVGLIVGSSLCIIPGVIWSVFTIYAPLLVLDKGFGPLEAIGESINLVKGKFGKVFVVLLVASLVQFAGLCFFGVGLLATIPVTVVTIAYSYRALSDESVAA